MPTRVLVLLIATCLVGTEFGAAQTTVPQAGRIERRTPPAPPPDKQSSRPPRDLDKWEVPPKDIPEKMRLVGFESRTLGRRVSYVIYLPPGYDINVKVRFPVIYALPGASGDCREVGILAQRLDTMIRRKQSAASAG